MPRSLTRALAVASIFAILAAIGLISPAVFRHLRTNIVRGSSSPSDTLVASIRAEPRSFNRYLARDLTTTVITLLMHAGLVKVDRLTNRLEPELAEQWELLPDNRTYRLHLRRDVRFSDGSPFTADDVAFSFRAIYDKAAVSVLAETLEVHGRPLTVVAEDAATVLVQFPSAFGPGLRVLDGVPMYPRHRLEPALSAGRFASAWGPGSAPSELAGLGPFVLARHDPGQRLVFDRNPQYWQRLQGLPRVSHVVLQVVPEQDTELLQLETGDIDLTQGEMRPSDVPALNRAAREGRVVVADAGIGLDGDLFWLNLTAAKARDRRSPWLQHADFRRAISQSIDRQAFVDAVYFGAAVPADSIVSPGNRTWHAAAPPPAFDLASARRLLTSLGLSDLNGDGILDDRDGRPVRLALLTQAGNTSLERGASFIRDSLAPIGVQVDVVKLEAGAFVDALMRGDYDAAYFRLLTTDPDPSLNLDFWLSGGSAHVWNPEQRKASAPWEADIDALMDRVSATLDDHQRAAVFADVQRIVAREVPVLCFAFPRLPIAYSSRVADASPAPFRPPLLWNPAAISLRAPK